jgi:hypothetical protein
MPFLQLLELGLDVGIFDPHTKSSSAMSYRELRQFVSRDHSRSHQEMG